MLTKESNDDLLSIRQAAHLLRVNRMWLSGYLAGPGKGIKVQRAGRQLVIKRCDLARIELPPRKEV